MGGDTSRAAKHTGPAHHAVQFYQNDAFLIGEVRRYVDEGLRAGRAVVVVATAAHRSALRQGPAPTIAADGQYREIDAEEALQSMACDGALDPDVFERSIAKPIADACGCFGHVCVFDEIAALLCGRGDTANAVRLEKLWNGLLERLPVSLLCAYPMQCFDGEVTIISRGDGARGGMFLAQSRPGTFTRHDDPAASAFASQAPDDTGDASSSSSGLASRKLRRLNEYLEERIAEQAEKTRHAELQLQRMVAELPDHAIFSLDAEGGVLTWNLGAERIKGYTASEIIGQSFERFYSQEDRDAGAPRQALEMARRHGRHEMETWRVRKDGSRFWANVCINTVYGENGEVTGFIKITRDMSERKAFEEQLRQAQKMEAVGQLTGGVAHDFNNLLTIILGNLEVIERAATDDRKVSAAVAQARRGAERAASLNSQLLAFSRRQPLNPKPTSITQLVGGLTELLQRTLGESIAVKTLLSGGWHSDVDAHLLESAIVNLALNARDAMPDGGTLMLEVANAHLDENAIERESAPGDFVAIRVTDTGTGMPKSVLDHVLEPFFTTKPVGQGTGLGLSQVYGFVKQSGGRMAIRSEPGRGTTVEIYLPRFEGETVAPGDPALEPDDLPGGSESILLVEDEEGVRDYCSTSLREMGYTVIEAAEATTALRHLEETPRVDLLLTDIGLPGMNGGDLARQAQQLRPGLPVLFVSGYARGVVMRRGRIDANTELLLKPYTRSDLGRHVRRMLDARAPRNLRVLVVEDERNLRELVSDALRGFGMLPIEAGSAREARALLQGGDSPDLALIDIGLGDESGLVVMQELRALKADCPVIVASGYGDRLPDGESRVQDAKVVVLPKPFGLLALKRAIASLGF